MPLSSAPTTFREQLEADVEEVVLDGARYACGSDAAVQGLGEGAFTNLILSHLHEFCNAHPDQQAAPVLNNHRRPRRRRHRRRRAPSSSITPAPVSPLHRR